MNKTHNQEDKMSAQFTTKNGFRRNLFQYALIGVLSMGMVSLQGCFSSGEDEVAGTTGNTGNSGNGGAGGGTSGPDVGASSDAKMVLLADNLQLPSGDSGSVRITANLKNAKNNLMVGESVSFEPSSGSLQPLTDAQGQLKTDKLGNAVAILSSPHNPIPRTIKVTAIGGGSSSTIDIVVDGTQLEVDGPANAIALNQSTDLNVKLKAGDGSVLQQEKISVSSGEGISLGASEITTNKQGEATVTVTDTNGADGKIVLTALGGSVSSTFSLKVSPDSVSFTEPAKGAEPKLGVDLLVKVKLLKGGSALKGQTISFSITRGTIKGTLDTSDDKAETDDEGIAEINVQSDNAGGALLTASTEDEVASMDIEFVATTPAAVDLEAAPKQISLKQTSSITATVRDATNNLVKNKKVLFNLTDITGGNLSKGEVITNSLGQAGNVYTAGVQASGEGQVKVTAVVSGTAIEDTESLTVDPQNVRIIFGTGNEMFDDPQKAQYRVPYVIQVSDDGGPVAGVDVDLSVFPTGYYKGEYRLVDKQGRYSEAVPVEFKPTKWKAKYSVATICPAEDANKNGNIDGNEDSNGDGMLTPPAVVSVGPSPGLSPTVSNSKVTTDANGFAYFSLYYPENFAHWVEVELVAQTTQASRQSTFKLKTTPIAIASDVNDIDKAPPAPNGSPFGTGISCNNTD
jgi:hypothetical protein